MIRRCYNPNNVKYPNYGGRGITICDEWKNDYQSFKLWALDNGYTDDLTIDRIDVNLDYCPLNCRWADWETQENNRTNNVYIEYNGQKKTAREWGNILGVDRNILYDRVFMYGWSVERAFNQKVRQEIEITFNNETHTLKEWSNILQMNHDTLYNRIYREGKTVEEAFTTPIKPPQRLITYNGETLNIQEWADKLHMGRHVIEGRLKRGWSVERIMTTPTNSYRKNKEVDNK